MAMTTRIPTKMIPFIVHFVRKQWIFFLYMTLTSMSWGINEVIFPYFVKLIVNKLELYQGEPSMVLGELKYVLMSLAGMWLLVELGWRTQGFLMAYRYPRFRANIRESIFKYVKGHSHQYFAENFAGSIANKITEMPASVEKMMDIVVYIFMPMTIAVVLTVVLMWKVSAFFGMIMLVWVMVHLGVKFLFLRPVMRKARDHAEAVSTLSGRIVDSIGNILNVRLFSRSRYEDEYFKKHQDDEIKKSAVAMVVLEKMKIFQGSASLVMMGSLFYFLIKGWQEGWVTFGDFTFVGMAAFNLMGLLWYTSYQISLFTRESGRVNAALRLISAPHDITDEPDAKNLTVNRGEIVFDRVTFHYKKDKNIFENAEIRIGAGEKLGLVGLSGSGKSTFVNLILRFYDVSSGKIMIDGRDIKHVTQESLRRKIAMIPQDPSLFHRSLMENIRYGRVDASDEEVLEASKLAHCHEFIEELDDGYASMVGERGIKLSGGQRQRISIARAILKDAPILILDEATSALDSVTEKLIQKSIDELVKDKTTVIIAHRLSTLANMDRILVFDDGCIVEDGNIEELLTKDGCFAKLWHMQVDGFLPD